MPLPLRQHEVQRVPDVCAGAHMWSSGIAATQRHGGYLPDRDAGGNRKLGRGAGNHRKCSRNAQGSAKPLASRVPCAFSFAIVA